MKKSLYGVLFPKKVDERIDMGSVVRLCIVDYVVLGFEVRDTECIAYLVERKQYLKSNPTISQCNVKLENMKFIEQLDKKETLAYYMNLKLMGVNLNLDTRKGIKEQSENVYCKHRLQSDATVVAQAYACIAFSILLLMLIGGIIAKDFFVLLLSSVGTFCLGKNIFVGKMVWKRIKED